MEMLEEKVLQQQEAICHLEGKAVPTREPEQGPATDGSD
jgi:hypothetical protein